MRCCLSPALSSSGRSSSSPSSTSDAEGEGGLGEVGLGEVGLEEVVGLGASPSRVLLDRRRRTGAGVDAGLIDAGVPPEAHPASRSIRKLAASALSLTFVRVRLGGEGGR